MYWKEPFEQKKPKNPCDYVGCCIIAFDERVLFNKSTQATLRNLFWDEKYWSTEDKETKERFLSNLEKDLPKGDLGGGDFVISSDTTMPIKAMGDIWSKPWEPLGFLKKAGYRSILLTIGEENLAPNDWSYNVRVPAPIDYEKVQWLIRWLKEVFLKAGGYFFFLETYDYIMSLKQKDPRDYVYGLTFYSREMVETIGRERLLSAPVYQVEELENGGIMLQLQENPIAIINWQFRKKIMNHLGLKPKKYEPPLVSSWLENTKPPTGIKEPKKRETSVIVGLNVSEIMVKENLSLFDYFHEHVFPRVRGEVEPEFAFYKWFNKLETGLKAFLSGSWENEEFKVFVGEKVGGISGIRSWKRELGFTKLKKVERSVREKFKALNIKEEPLVVFLLYDFLEEE